MNLRTYMGFSRFLIALLSGVLLACCFEPFGASGLVWVWMLPLLGVLWSLRGRVRGRFRGPGWRGFGTAYAAGLGFWLLNLKWLWTVSGLGAVALALYLAVYFGLFGAFSARAGNPWKERKPRESASWRCLGYAIVNGLAWAGLEWLRGWLFTGFGWNGLGVAFSENLILAQGADLIGVAGLSFLPVMLSAVLLQVGRRLWERTRSGKGRIGWHWDFAVAVALLAGFFFYGTWRMKTVAERRASLVRVLLIQENTPQDLKWDPGEAGRICDGYEEGTRMAMESLEAKAAKELAKGREIAPPWPDLVIWPESALPEPTWLDRRGRRIEGQSNETYLEQRILEMGEFSLLAGTNVLTADRESWRRVKEEPVYNGVILLDSAGGMEGMQLHRKVHLVIFGEKIPFVDSFPFLKELFRFSSGAEFMGNMGQGKTTEPLVLKTSGGDVGIIPLVCFEDTVGRVSRRFTRKGKQMLVNVTNDGWFKNSEGAAQHFANSKFRAIELRRPMVRAANTGVTCVIQATGSEHDPLSGKMQVLLDESGSHFTRGWLEGVVFVPEEPVFSLYERWGDWFSAMALGMAIAWGTLCLLKEKRGIPRPAPSKPVADTIP